MVHDSMTDAPRRSAGREVEYEVPEAMARLMQCRAATCSFLAVMRHADAWRTSESILNRFILEASP